MKRNHKPPFGKAMQQKNRKKRTLFLMQVNIFSLTAYNCELIYFSPIRDLFGHNIAIFSFSNNRIDVLLKVLIIKLLCVVNTNYDSVFRQIKTQAQCDLRGIRQKVCRSIGLRVVAGLNIFLQNERLFNDSAHIFCSNDMLPICQLCICKY